MNLLIMGKPGAGKGTQAKKLLEHYKLTHISTGDIYREEMKNNSKIGIEAKKYISQGNLVPDDMTNEIVKKVLSTHKYPNGFMLDGYPRTDAQADALDATLNDLGIKLTAVINVDVRDDVLLHRMAGRRVCSNCGHPYHVDYHPPKVKGICDFCGGHLVQRPDDLEDAVMNRLNIYNEKTRPLLQHYQKQGLLRIIDGGKTSDEVFNDIVSKLGE
ncbi:adenylate kinase [Candidatus Izemoplasma sp. B36]|uniref:adenylate kinase n=1 Tax=Candidatus Izemoplasma sp. B36 TaxID=3242468 RepID=UPI003556CC4E